MFSSLKKLSNVFIVCAILFIVVGIFVIHNLSGKSYYFGDIISPVIFAVPLLFIALAVAVRKIASELGSEAKVNISRMDELEKARGKIDELEKRLGKLEKGLYEMTK